MSTLAALLAEDAPEDRVEEPNPEAQPTRDGNKPPTLEETILGDGAKLEPSALGDAVNNAMVNWNQLLSNIITNVGHVQPTQDHVKELAEFSVKQIKEACLDVTRELHRVSLEWRMLHPEEALKEDISDYKEAVDRQNHLLNTTEEKFEHTLERYKRSQ